MKVHTEPKPLVLSLLNSILRATSFFELSVEDITTQTTRTVKITDFVEAHPSSILISEAVPGPSGRLRLFTQKVQVPDTDLWQKFIAEVKKGETIQVTVKTAWPDSGPY